MIDFAHLIELGVGKNAKSKDQSIAKNWI